MGVFGTGLYSGDFAMDLRTTISAVSRLPFDNDKLVDIIRETEPASADDPNDQDHTTFWLVLADQFAKRGIVCDRVRSTALTIVDGGGDLAMLTKLGMSPPDLKKRRKVLDDLRARIVAPTNSRPRPVLKKPQAFVMEVGDVWIYPTDAGRCINPHFAFKEENTFWTKDGTIPWKQDGWSAMVVVDRGRAFDFLSWYRPLTVSAAMVERPTLGSLRGELLWKLAPPGTMSRIHLKRMELEKVGALPVDSRKLRQAFPDMRPGTSYAVNDISIANRMNVGPDTPAELMPRPGEPLNFRRGRPYPTILGIEQILSD